MKQKYSVLAAAGIALVLFSLVVFIAPIPKTAVFWVAYLFAVIAMVAQLGFVHVAFSGGTSARSKFYGYPIFRVGMVYLGVQLVLSLVFMLLGKWVPMWIPVVSGLVIMGLAALGLLATDNVRDSVILVEEKQAANTGAMRSLRRNADVLVSRYPEFQDLAESLHYADPVATPATEAMEQRLASMMAQVDQCPDEQSRLRLKNKMLELLEQRNAVCKSSKTR